MPLRAFLFSLPPCAIRGRINLTEVLMPLRAFLFSLEYAREFVDCELGERLNALAGVFVFSRELRFTQLKRRQYRLNALAGVFVFSRKTQSQQTANQNVSLNALAGVFVFSLFQPHWRTWDPKES